MNVSYAKEHGNGSAGRSSGTPPTEKIKRKPNNYRKASIIRVAKCPTLPRGESCRTGCRRKKKRNFHVYKKDHIETGLALIQEVTDLLGLLFQCNAHAQARHMTVHLLELRQHTNANRVEKQDFADPNMCFGVLC
jgi:hypothetical protein